MKKSFLSSSSKGFRSPLSDAQRLSSKSPAKVGIRDLAQALPLTSLIDAFSIIVIYLLIGTQSGGIETSVKDIQLPMAQNSQALDKEVVVLRIHNNRLFLDEKPITLQSLEQKLAQLKKQATDSKGIELMVQADQNMEFAALDPLIKAGSLAGVEKLKFAVLPPK